VLFARRGGVDVGFAMFRRTHKWDRARPAGELTVWALVGDPAARLALLRRLIDFDLIGTVKIGTVGIEDPMLFWVGGPRSTSDVATYDSLWVRLVDLPEALQDRAWSAPCDVVVEVADAAAPWNDGRWRIRADDTGRATVERTTAESDVHLQPAALGAAYLGGGNLVALQRAGLVAERRKGAVAELWRAMRTETAPTAAVGF
jgi:predicted acetyltransferase